MNDDTIEKSLMNCFGNALGQPLAWINLPKTQIGSIAESSIFSRPTQRLKFSLSRLSHVFHCFPRLPDFDLTPALFLGAALQRCFQARECSSFVGRKFKLLAIFGRFTDVYRSVLSMIFVSWSLEEFIVHQRFVMVLFVLDLWRY